MKCHGCTCTFMDFHFDWVVLGHTGNMCNTVWWETDVLHNVTGVLRNVQGVRRNVPGKLRNVRDVLHNTPLCKTSGL